MLLLLALLLTAIAASVNATELLCTVLILHRSLMHTAADLVAMPVRYN
jgi:hypothetical protein